MKSSVHFANLVEASPARTVYRNADTTDPSGHEHFLYYYFIGGRLNHIDEGERKPDMIAHQ
ncbi:MAG: hypothetical protein JWQ84_1691 [Mucilaginibacter sp.]|nr:hypothetical protein [Mucilaginibacter sp.]